ncbi:sigma-54-dependent Fis family transcriptional regulator [Methylobacillus gramineus]|uniref:sigma-54-dependent Fis family transcriptional regulator n=1 Tax=Methylobacillus gramineus TaxID=755169 RepID=UPI001CFFFCA4|nr:sigma-54-dependent Fis family transcriptional regulator [Methylobacillus gramineus]MCB5184750.1 sigma-54-dependent Fis family transcriptional regulator [Methylobacillus gramineus]
MQNPASNYSQLLNARNEFLARGVVEDGQIAEEIQRSWRRCVENGMDADSPIRTEILTRQELRLKQETHHLLLSQARPEMDSLNEQISHTRSVIVLTDNEGIILHSLGNSEFLNDAQRIALMPGCSWQESLRGTNAIGTALVERSAMTVQGAEHFLDRNHVLGCSAVPIFNAGNEVMGTLDVSTDINMPQQHTLALVRMSAQMIENRLFTASHSGAYSLHFHSRAEFIGTLWEGIAIFDHEDRLVALNRSGQFQLGLSADRMQGLRFEHLFDALPVTHDRSGKQENFIFPMHTSHQARIYARMESRQTRTESAITPVAPTRRNCAASLDMLDTGDTRVSQVISQVKRVIDQQIPILIEGETGAGKELFARAIHEVSSRRDGPWIAVNCAALPEGLIESELFGYEEGAFTGARRKGSPGKLEQADGGTLFLDEIGDMPMALQARLLRVLQERSVTPLGSSKAKPVDFALLSATNQKLREKVESGEFRRDLYYRLNGLTINLPALRQRDDLRALIATILQTENATNAKIDEEVMQLFESHPWPGNIRQLHNVLRTALALAGGDTIQHMHLTGDFFDDMDRYPQQTISADTLTSLTSDAIKAALQTHSGNISAVARQLGISRNTLYRRMREMNLA